MDQLSQDGLINSFYFYLVSVEGRGELPNSPAIWNYLLQQMH